MKRQSRKEYAVPGDQAGNGAAGLYLEFLNLMANARSVLADLRKPKNCEAALSLEDGHPSTGSGQVPSTGSGQVPSTGSGQAFDEVYQLAADMGGMGPAAALRQGCRGGGRWYN